MAQPGVRKGDETMVVSCEEVWREVSNYLEEDTSPELRAAMDEENAGNQTGTAPRFWKARAMWSSCMATRTWFQCRWVTVIACIAGWKKICTPAAEHFSDGWWRQLLRSWLPEDSK